MPARRNVSQQVHKQSFSTTHNQKKPDCTYHVIPSAHQYTCIYNIQSNCQIVRFTFYTSFHLLFIKSPTLESFESFRMRSLADAKAPHKLVISKLSQHSSTYMACYYYFNIQYTYMYGLLLLL